MAGNNSYVINGFNIAIAGIGGAASALEMATASAAMMHPLASESGTIFFVSADRATEVLNPVTNSRIQGSFTSSTTNYIGIDLRRTADDATSDVVAFYDPDTEDEFTEEVALARTLDYSISISTTPFSATPALCPIAKVVTDAANGVVSITDARPLFFRLGSGGNTPNTQYAYTWPASREENITGDIFAGGDKTITNQKDWQDAIMSRVWEIGGGKYWYSPTADRNVQLVRDTATGPFSNGDWFEWVGGDLHWQGLSFLFENSGLNGVTAVVRNTIADQVTDEVGLTDLVDGEVIYVDLDRHTNATLTAVKGAIHTLGYPEVPGTRFVIAYNNAGEIFARGAQRPVGSTYTPATINALGIVSLSHAEASAGDSPVVYSIGAANVASGVVALDSNIRATWTSTTGNALSATSGAGDGRGLTGVGHGTGEGVKGTGGGSIAGAIGVVGQGSGLGTGVVGTGGLSSGTIGVKGVAGSVSGVGGSFVAGATSRISVLLDGTLDIMEEASTPAAPSSTQARLYLANNGLVTPNKRQQVYIRFGNGQVLKIAESDPY